MTPASEESGFLLPPGGALLVPYGDDCLTISRSGQCAASGAPVTSLVLADGVLVVELGLPWSTWAAAPATVAAVGHAVLASPGRRLLEFGPGLSTVAVGLAADFAGLDVEVVGVEQDASWAKAVLEALPESPHVSASIVLAPLVPAVADQAPFPLNRWYDREALDAVQGRFDVVLVDGPTAFQPEWQYDRWPALDFVRPMLADGATIVLDDATREGEGAIGLDWLARLGDGWQASMVDRSLWLRHRDIN